MRAVISASVAMMVGGGVVSFRIVVGGTELWDKEEEAENRGLRSCQQPGKASVALVA